MNSTIFHAIGAAQNAPHIYDLLISIYNGEFDTTFPIDGLENEWLYLYRDRYEIAYTAYGIFATTIENRDYFQRPKINGFYLKKYKEGKNLSKFQAEKQIRCKYLNAKINPLLAVDLSPIRMQKPSPHVRAVTYRAVFRAALHLRFFFRITLPAFLIYGRDHIKLYYNSRHGKTEHLCALLRLDKAIALDPMIAPRISLALTRNKTSEDKKIAQAYRGRIPKPNPRRLKALMAAYASLYSKNQGTPLSHPKIQQLFDKAASSSVEIEIDTDLPETPDDFRRYVNRAMPIWTKWKQDKLFDIPPKPKY